MSNLTDLQRIKQSVETFNGLGSLVIDVDIVFNFFRSNQDLFRRTRLFTLQCDLIFHSGDERQACEYLIGDDAAFNTFIEQLQMTYRFFEAVNINELSNVDGDLALDRRIEDYSNGDAAQDDVIVVHAEILDQGEGAKRLENIVSITALSVIFIALIGTPLYGTYMGFGESDYLILGLYLLPVLLVISMLWNESLPRPARNDSNVDPNQHPEILQVLPAGNDSDVEQYPEVIQAVAVDELNDSVLDPASNDSAVELS